MSSIRASRIGAAVVAAALSLASSAQATDPWAELQPRPQDLVGTLSCASASCHGRTSPQPSTSRISQQEYVHWLGADAKYREGRRGYDPRAQLEQSTADPHALAALRIQQPRFQEVLRRASRLPDGSNDATMYDRCARCHDPLGLSHSSPHAPREVSVTRSRPAERVPRTTMGIGCESCHGGGRQWLAVHYERDISRERLTELGMIDTKNLLVRGRQCSGCHVGSADQDMNHDMIAAGHPPLRFELASYEALLPRKHWNDQPRRLGEPDYEVQLWAAGRIAAAEAALALLEGRARRAAGENDVARQAPWPEFAEANCFACHQPLRSEVNTRSLTSLLGRGGVPTWQTWNVALLPQSGDSFASSLAELRAAMERSLLTDPAPIARLAAEAKRSLYSEVRLSSSGVILGLGNEPLGIDVVLTSLARSTEPATWDRWCHELTALVAVERSLHDRGGSASVNSSTHFRQRSEHVAAALRFKSSGSEWPAVFSDSPRMSLDDVGTQLAAIRRELTAAAKLIDCSKAGQEALP